MLRPPTRPARDLSYVIAFSFGNRIPPGLDAKRHVGEPGPVNEQLAAIVVTVVGDRAIPIYAQTEIAEVLSARYAMSEVIEIGPNRAADGTLIYLSTSGVAWKVAELRGASKATGSAGVVAFADHLWRAVYTARNHGLDAYALDSPRMPSSYDRRSGQPWTRSRARYLPVDLVTRLRLLPHLQR